MNNTLKGMTMAGLAAVFWGSMGVAGQYLLQNCHFKPMDLISIRMLLAGSIFVGIEFFLLKRGALKIFETKQNIIDLIIYTLTIIGTQLTFFVCIQYANAPFAAVLTATVPLWIMLFMFVFQHKHLTVKEIFCGIVAVAGVVLVVTGGSFKNFNVSGIGFWAGIGSGITGAFYVLLPQKVIARVGSGLATSWALLLTGVSVTLFSHFWNEPLDWTVYSILAYAFIVLFGTIAAFWLFQAAAEIIPADVAGMMETFDPVAATLLSMIFLGVSVNSWECIGGALILGAVAFLAVPSKHPFLIHYSQKAKPSLSKTGKN